VHREFTGAARKGRSPLPPDGALADARRMSATAALFALLFVWLLTGIVCSFVMARRGHDPWSWGMLGALLGPLVVPLALATRTRDRATDVVVDTWHTGKRGPGPVTALVGFDGSRGAEAAARTVVELLGPRLGRLVLATVIDFDAADRAHVGRRVSSATAEVVLRAAAGQVVDVGHDTVELIGEPAHALVEYALANDVDLLAVGTHGHGLGKAVLGNVAQRLVQQHEVPVLVVSADARRREAHTAHRPGHERAS
jgi:nucleotide-binding universal stress UspA family protein